MNSDYNVFTVRTNRRVYQELVELRSEVGNPFTDPSVN